MPAARLASSPYVSDVAPSTIAMCSGARRTAASISDAKLCCTRLLQAECLRIDALPDLGRHAMAGRVGCERRLGGRVDAPFPGVAILTRRRIEIGAARIR